MHEEIVRLAARFAQRQKIEFVARKNSHPGIGPDGFEKRRGETQQI